MRNWSSLLILLLFVSACGKREKYPYAISDFRAELRPALLYSLDKGYCGSHLAASLFDRADLRRVSRSSHPLLRAEALLALAYDQRDSSFLLAHLDDTAVVFVDAGEFGYEPKTVSDAMIDAAVRLFDSTFVTKLLDTVVTRYSFLRSASRYARRLPLLPKYRPHFRAIVLNRQPFESLEPAVSQLAAFGNDEDTALIRSVVLKHLWEARGLSFALIEARPLPSYFDVLERFADTYLLRRVPYLDHSDESFFSAVAAYRNQRAATLLERCLLQIRKAGGDDLRPPLVKAVLLHPCPAFSKLTVEARRFDARRMRITGRSLADTTAARDEADAPAGYERLGQLRKGT